MKLVSEVGGESAVGADVIIHNDTYVDESLSLLLELWLPALYFINIHVQLPHVWKVEWANQLVLLLVLHCLLSPAQDESSVSTVLINADQTLLLTDEFIWEKMDFYLPH